jgi:hypothetical protein
MGKQNGMSQSDGRQAGAEPPAAENKRVDLESAQKCAALLHFDIFGRGNPRCKTTNSTTQEDIRSCQTTM